MTQARYVLIADEASISYILVDLQERRVVHTVPRLIWSIISGLVSDQSAIAAAVAAADPETASADRQSSLLELPPRRARDPG